MSWKSINCQYYRLLGADVIRMVGAYIYWLGICKKLSSIQGNKVSICYLLLNFILIQKGIYIYLQLKKLYVILFSVLLLSTTS